MREWMGTFARSFEQGGANYSGSTGQGQTVGWTNAAGVPGWASWSKREGGAGCSFTAHVRGLSSAGGGVARAPRAERRRGG